MLNVFDLLPYKEGFLLMAFDPADPTSIAAPVPQEKMYRAFTEHLAFNNIVGVNNVGEMNFMVQEGKQSDLVSAVFASSAFEIVIWKFHFFSTKQG